MNIATELYEPNLIHNNELDTSSQDSEESVSSETSSSYESQECIVLNDDSNRVQKTVIVSGTNAGLFRKSEILEDKNYESAEERPIEDEPFPSVLSNFREESIYDSQVQPIEEVNNGPMDEEFFDQDIEKSSNSSENVQIIEVKYSPNSEKALPTEEKVQVFVESPKKTDKSEVLIIKEPKHHLSSHKKTESQVANAEHEKVIRNSLTEIVRSESISKNTKRRSGKGGESCSKCRIF